MRMATMNRIAEGIRELIEQSRPLLLAVGETEAERRRGPHTWSKKEVIGHLIDSAANNHQRFVRAARNEAGDFPPYDQEAWVAVQRYNGVSWGDLLDLWESYNRHLCWVIENIPQDALSNPCSIGKEHPVPLEFVITDYLRHLRHHLEKIVP
jgi:hypothetical protein